MQAEVNISRLSQMAKLNLTGGESKEIEKYIEILVKDLERLSVADTDGAKPFIHAIGRTNVMREDKVVKKIDRGTLLANAPDHEGGYFKAPKTVE